MGSNKSRWAQLGDMLVYKDPYSHEKCIGLVYKEIMVGGSDSVLVKWSGATPPHYMESYGYSKVNIHNQHDQFEVIKVK